MMAVTISDEEWDFPGRSEQRDPNSVSFQAIDRNLPGRLAASLNHAAFFLLGHRMEVGEADVPVPHVGLPQLEVSRQKLGGVRCLSKADPALGAAAPGRGSGARGAPEGLGPRSLPQRQCPLWAPSVPHSVSSSGRCREAPWSAKQPRPALGTSAAVPGPAVPELRSRCPAHRLGPAGSHPVSRARSLGPFSRSLL